MPGGFPDIAGITACTQKLVYHPYKLGLTRMLVESADEIHNIWLRFSQGHDETYQYPSKESFPVHLVENIIINLYLRFTRHDCNPVDSVLDTACTFCLMLHVPYIDPFSIIL